MKTEGLNYVLPDLPYFVLLSATVHLDVRLQEDNKRFVDLSFDFTFFKVHLDSTSEICGDDRVQQCNRRSKDDDYSIYMVIWYRRLHKFLFFCHIISIYVYHKYGTVYDDSPKNPGLFPISNFW